MANKKLKKQLLLKKLYNKRRLVILNEDTFEETFSLKLNLMNVEYYKDHLKEVRLKHRIYQSHSRAKELLCEGTYTPKQWQECLEFFGNKCAYTGKILNSENINIEHI